MARKRRQLLVGRFAGAHDGAELAVILVIATEIFPGKASGRNRLRVSIFRR